MKIVKILISLVLLLSCFWGNSPALSFAPGEIKKLIDAFKKDERGPYQAIRWFCPDGTMVLPNQRCPQPGGQQHALHKDVVQRLAKEQGIYLGQILAGTSHDDFLDAANGYSRLMQYQVEKYIKLIDDGWILRRARYYRGAIQAEDEQDWGVVFLKWLINEKNLQSRFFLIRQAVKHIPHWVQADQWKQIRAQARIIAEQYPPFTNLRVKLHGQPERDDLSRVKHFLENHQKNLPDAVEEILNTLIVDLGVVFQPIQYQTLNQYLGKIPSQSPIKGKLIRLLEIKGDTPEAVAQQMKIMADMLWEIRKSLPEIHGPKNRLAIMDLSNDLGNFMFLNISSWEPSTIDGLFEKAWVTSKALAGCGYLEMWEWETIAPIIAPEKAQRVISVSTFVQRIEACRRIVEWSTGSVRAYYNPAVNLFARFEPLAEGFIDDRIHSSLLLAMGQTTAKLTAIMNRFIGASNHVFHIDNPHHIRGINPGFAVGELVVIENLEQSSVFKADKIYVLSQPPVDMKPVAGIAAVSEGNLVSHMQLLARNLGIPNAVLSSRDLKELVRYNGQKVFYAVSPRGTVVMKPVSEMTAEENELLVTRSKIEEKIWVPTKKIDLKQELAISLKNVRASDSGRICGPKAANLGELKHIFPNYVVDGLVVPFGVFKKHLKQTMPDTELTYWCFLQDAFARSAEGQKNGETQEDIEAALLKRLDQLRDAIRTMDFTPDFRQHLQKAFIDEFGAAMGEIPVFVRSDTNMEDLKDFTGAGLNLTVFNVVNQEDIFQAIKDVWASPFKERSYQWRQKYLLNPQHVYPSILILPSVNVEKSGVMITSGVSSSNPEDTTIAFSRGAGGAVEGQVAETVLFHQAGEVELLSPSRELSYTTLPLTGGVEKTLTTLDQPILTPDELKQLFDLSKEIRLKLPGTAGIESCGPFDVELGFKGGAIQLFQVRPFVENRRARSAEYLKGLDARIPEQMYIILDQPVDDHGIYMIQGK